MTLCQRRRCYSCFFLLFVVLVLVAFVCGADGAAPTDVWCFGCVLCLRCWWSIPALFSGVNSGLCCAWCCPGVASDIGGHDGGDTACGDAIAAMVVLGYGVGSAKSDVNGYGGEGNGRGGVEMGGSGDGGGVTRINHSGSGSDGRMSGWVTILNMKKKEKNTEWTTDTVKASPRSHYSVVALIEPESTSNNEDAADSELIVGPA